MVGVHKFDEGEVFLVEGFMLVGTKKHRRLQGPSDEMTYRSTQSLAPWKYEMSTFLCESVLFQ